MITMQLISTGPLMDSAQEHPDAMPEATITNALEGVRSRISHMNRQRGELERSLAVAREEERLLLRLLALRRGVSPEDDCVVLTEENKVCGDEQPAPFEAREEADHPVVQAVLRELAGAGRPLHISELMRLLRDRQVQIPGAGTQANLITHLRRDARLVRPSRGMYGLTAWGLENMPASAPRRRRRKRVRSKAIMERTET
jgi:hypothetical protein